MKLRFTLQEPCSRSLGHFSQPPWVTSKNAQLPRPFPEAPTSHVQAPAHKNTASEGPIQIHWHPDFTKGKREVRQVKWLAHTASQWQIQDGNQFPGPQSKVVSNSHSYAWNKRPTPWLFSSKPSEYKQPKAHYSTSARSPPGSYSSDTEGLTALSTVYASQDT